MAMNNQKRNAGCWLLWITLLILAPIHIQFKQIRNTQMVKMLEFDKHICHNSQYQ